MLTLYLLSTFNIGQDGDFDQKQAVLTYNAKLANNLGNLVNRVVVLALKITENSGVLENSNPNLNSNTKVQNPNLNSFPFQGQEATIEKLF